ncbi:MAG TPA: SGNH/GDSL hydrolase family protein [Vicinamibacterales bacterium]|nr:SGNH/GDSL hydrolase family protein [Vicinamibacterales bacterium]
MSRLTKRLVPVVAALLASASLVAQSNRGQHWVGTWATAVVARPQGGGPARRGGPPAPPPLVIDNQTLRQVVHTTIGGTRVRVVFSNEFGTTPVEIGTAHVALRAMEGAIVPSSDRTLMFSGRAGFQIPPGAIAVSDPVQLAVPEGSDLVVDLYLPGEVGSSASPLTMHGGANQTIYVSTTGNHAGEPSLAGATVNRSWYLLSHVDVDAPAQTSAVVTFGDSITDGTRSTPDTNSRWPDELARRLEARHGGHRFAVLNAGIAGNQVLGDGFPGAGVNALSRFERDVLALPGVSHVIVMEAINDIGLARANPTPSADDLIAGHKQLIARAHDRGLKIYGATLTPFEGAAYYSPEGEAKREAVNNWIRTSGAYDGVVDFDKVIRDPAAPTKFLPQFDSGDHLHPNDAGYKAMGDAVDLGLFK